MKRFAFYGRVSTEDQQDPASSRAWQVDRAHALVGSVDGVIVAEYFDIGLSRSLPWPRRPESARLLADIRRPDRGFEAIVVGELARAFGHDMDRHDVMRQLEHFGIELWHPDAAGRHDKTNIGHRITAALRAELAQEERETIRRRVRDAMRSQAQHEGRYLGGRPPYGFRLADAGPHPNPSKAATGQRLRRLERDPATAPVVLRIFREYVEGSGLLAIAERLTREDIPSPSGADPARNRHRQSARGAWGKSAVRAILLNPRYLGHEVWNRQPTVERLVDIENTGLGYETKQTHSDPSEWVWSAKVHDELVPPELFERAQRHLLAGRKRPLAPKRRKSPRAYILRGLLRCGVCGRAMTGEAHGARQLYRCKFPSEYAIRSELEHPKSVSVGEACIVEALDGWLLTAFADENIDETIDALLAVQGTVEPDAAKLQAAERAIDDCDRRLAKFRAALEADADPRVVSTWIADVQRDRLAAERIINDAAGRIGTYSREQLRALIESVDVAAKLRHAGRSSKQELYEGLGVELSYHPSRRVVTATCGGWGNDRLSERVGGGITPPIPPLTRDLNLPKIRP